MLTITNACKHYKLQSSEAFNTHIIGISLEDGNTKMYNMYHYNFTVYQLRGKCIHTIIQIQQK